MAATTALTSLEFLVTLNDRMTGKMKGITQSFTKMQRAADAGFKNLGKGALGMIGVGATISGLVNPALEDLKVSAEMKSLGILGDDLEQLKKTAGNFAIEFGVDDDAFVRSAAHIKKAIPDVGSAIAAYTYDVNLLAKATGSSEEVTASYVGKMTNLFDNLAKTTGKKEWVDALTGMTAEASKIFNTSAEDISAAFNKLGSIGVKSGVSLSEQMAMIGSLQTKGFVGGKAGGAYKSFLESAEAGGRKLGMSFTDAKGAILPMVEVIDKLKSKFGETLDPAEMESLRKSFGKGSDAIIAMYNQTDKLQGSIGKLNDASTGGMKTAEEMAKARTNSFEQFASAVNLLRESFGHLILKAVQPFLNFLVPMVTRITELTDRYPTLAKWIGIITVSVIGLTAAISAMYIVMGICKMATVALIVVQKLWNLSLFSCPITWVVLALIGLALVIKEISREMWGLNSFQEILDAWIGGLGYLWDIIKATGMKIGEFVTGVVEGFGLIVWGVGQLIEYMTDFGAISSAVGSMVGAIFGGIGNGFSWLWDMIIKLVEKIQSIPGINWIMEKIFGESPGSAMSSESVSSQGASAGVPALDQQRKLDIPAGGLTNNIGGNKTTSYGDVNIYASGGMSPAQMEEWNALRI